MTRRPVLHRASPGRYWLEAATGRYWLVNSHRTRKPWRLYLRIGTDTHFIGAYPTKGAGLTALGIRLDAQHRLSEVIPRVPDE